MPRSNSYRNSYTVDLHDLPKVTMMANPVEEVNVSRAQWLTNAFHFLFSTAKGCLYPFLTIYLRYLGLTPLQTGIVLGTRAFLTVWCGSLWTSCAYHFNKRRISIMLSLYILIGTFIGLAFVPPVDLKEGLQHCLSSRGEAANSSISRAPTSHVTGSSVRTGAIVMSTMVSSSPLSVPSVSELAPPPVPGGPAERSSSVSSSAASTLSSVAQASPPSTTHETPSVMAPHVPMSSMSKKTSMPTTKLEPSSSQHAKTVQSSVHPVKLTTKTTSTSTMATRPPPTKRTTHRPHVAHHHRTTTMSINDMLAELSDADLRTLQELGLTMDDIKSMSQDDLEQYLMGALEQLNHGNRRKRHSGTKDEEQVTVAEVYEPSTWDKFKAALTGAKVKLLSRKYKTFATILLIVLISGIFASPVEKLADKCWFEFLDSIDVLEKYGQHAIWGTMGFVFSPLLVTTIIDHVPCSLSLRMYNFAIHVFTFAAMCGVVFVLALFYPIQHKRTKHRKKAVVSKGLKTICNDAHASTLTITMYVVGLCQAAVAVFLFWKIQDLKGGEMPMGLSVTVAALVELIMYFVHKGIVRKLGSGGSVVFSLVIMSARIVCYSFLPFAWLAVLGEAFYGFSNSLLWHAVHSYPDFRISALITDRSAASLLNNIHHGFGFATGCVVSGVVVQFVCIERLFQGTAGLLFLWAVMSALIFKFVKKKHKVRYTQLLQGENDGSQSSDEDWLEVALKEVK